MRSTGKQHGMSRHRAYNTWNHMMHRCYYPTDANYRYYGGRGITVTPKWHSFSGFWQDMKRGYRKSLTLDRINNNGNYNKKNCRWITYKSQVRNRSNSLYVQYQGTEQYLYDLCQEKNTAYNRVYQRIKRYGWSPERALGEKSRNVNGRRKLKSQLNHA